MTMATATTRQDNTEHTDTRKITLTHYRRYWSATVSLSHLPAKQTLGLAQTRTALTAQLEPNRLDSIQLDLTWSLAWHIFASAETCASTTSHRMEFFGFISFSALLFLLFLSCRKYSDVSQIKCDSRLVHTGLCMYMWHAVRFF